MTKAAAVWLSDRSADRQREADLAALVQRRFTDVFGRRTLERQLEAIADDVARRLAPLCEAELRDLPEGEKSAALDAVMRTFEAADLSDEGIFAVDADPAKLLAHLRGVAGPALAGAALGAAGTELFHRVLADCAACLLAVVVALPPFDARAPVEILRRLSSLDSEVRQALARLPRPTLEAPAGTGLDEDFRRRYLRQVSAELDVLEMPGLTTRRYRPRTTLTVAYLSLSMAARDATRVHRRRGVGPERVDPESWARAAGTPGGEDAERGGAVRAETALAGSSRMLVRGAPGSGKTTLLAWLAVTAARGAFEGDLRDWNGCVPFVVTLRRYVERPLPPPEELPAETAPMTVGLMPRGWAHRELTAGRALLLVDGVDEVAESRRAMVRQWLRQVVREFPRIRVVVTSRPAAAGRDWLRDLGFSSATVENMTPGDVRAFVHRWHRAAADAAGGAEALPCPPAELSRYEGKLLSQLDAEPRLRTLAENPLLCALLCVLNLDRNAHLPRDRMGLYDAALDMLLERRDAEREIPVDAEIAMDARAKATVLRALAWWLSLDGRVDLPKSRAAELLRGTLATMPAVTAAPEAVLAHLLTRSGVVREPTEDRVDFVHRTFQEYLTAQEAADQGHSGLLVDRAHLDQWRETIVMAAGHGHKQFREELLGGLLERAEREPRHARQLHLLAVSCLETVPTADADLLAEVDARLAELLPPRRVTEARSLAAAGRPVLHRLPPTLDDLSEAAAAAIVRTAALIHGPDALGVLARYGTDPRRRVQEELIRAWEYFDPEEYARRVLADSPLDGGELTLTNRAVLPGVGHLRHLRELTLDLNDDHMTDLAWLRDIPRLHDLQLDAPKLHDLSGLVDHRGLQRLWVRTGESLDLGHTGELTGLTQLTLWSRRLTGDLQILGNLTKLEHLGLDSLPDGTDFAVLTELPRLRDLVVYGECVPSAAVLRRLPGLTGLCLSASRLNLSLGGLVRTLPELTLLVLYDCTWVDDLAPLATLPLHELILSGAPVSDLAPLASHCKLWALFLRNCPNIRSIDPLRGHDALTSLDLRGTAVSDLRPLTESPALTTLWLDNCHELGDLGPLGTLPRLTDLRLTGVRPGLDLSPLAGKKITITLHEGQDVRGLEALGRRPRVVWTPPPATD